MKTFFHKLYFILIIIFVTIGYLFTNDGFHYCIAADDSIAPLPIYSGPVTALPWDSNEEFIKAKRENNANKLIAAYKTVLLDPLPGEEYNVHLAAKLLCGTVVRNGSLFSMNKTIGPYTLSRGFKKGPTYAGIRLITTTGGGICKVATTLYNVAVLSNLHISERHYHGMPVSYVPYGQDATVSYGSYDFRFKNNASSPILIWSQGIDDTLYVGFYGNYTPPKIEWQHEVLDINKTTIIYKKNKTLPSGIKRTVVHGMNGKTIKSFVKITYPDGTTKTKYMGISRYKPLPYIIEMGN